MAVEGDSSQRSVSWIERLMIGQWRKTVSTMSSIERATNLARFLQVVVAKKGIIRKLPLPLLSGWTKSRDFPALAPKSFAQLWQEKFSEETDG